MDVTITGGPAISDNVLRAVAQEFLGQEVHHQESPVDPVVTSHVVRAELITQNVEEIR